MTLEISFKSQKQDFGTDLRGEMQVCLKVEVMGRL